MRLAEGRTFERKVSTGKVEQQVIDIAKQVTEIILHAEPQYGLTRLRTFRCECLIDMVSIECKVGYTPFTVLQNSPVTLREEP